ncbi:MAG TPA: tetratricopeptide repeat protein, partial [Candidatus Binatia bacterium]|nr:tetratricopeptide repeat protein [Candidatus Binatia bacterium]
MTKKRFSQPAPRSAWNLEQPGTSLRRRTLVLIFVLLALGLGLCFVRRGTSPGPPAIATTGFEPVIAAQIDGALAEVRARPRSGSAWGKLGMVLQAHELVQARFCFEQAERFESSDARWPYLQALLPGLDNPSVAIAKLERAARLRPEQPDAVRLRLAQSLFEAGRWKEAESHFKRLLQGNTNLAPAWLGLAALSHAGGQLDEASRRLQFCLTNAHTAKRAYTLLAQVERQLGHTASADAAVHLLATLPGDQPWPDPFTEEAAQYRVGRQAWAEQAQQWLEQDRPGEAQRLAARLIKDYPEAPEGWLLLGRLRLGQNDCAGAAQALRRHLQLAPRSVN